MRNKSEIFISIVFILLLVFFLNPFNVLMPDPLVTMMITLLLLLFGIFASFIFHEKARDERENLHKLIAARYAYLAGAGVLVVGIIYQTLQHALDTFLVVTLIVMILARIFGFIYAKKHY